MMRNKREHFSHRLYSHYNSQQAMESFSKTGVPTLDVHVQGNLLAHREKILEFLLR